MNQQRIQETGKMWKWKYNSGRSVFLCGIRYSVHGGYILKINCPVLLHRCGRVADCLFLVKTNFVSTPITRSCQWLLCLVDTAHCASLLHYVTLRHITLMFRILQFWHRYCEEYARFGESSDKVISSCWFKTFKLYICWNSVNDEICAEQTHNYHQFSLK